MRRFTERLHRVLLEAFDFGSLSQMLFFRLNERLDRIASMHDDFDMVVFRLVLWADQQDRFLELVRATADAIPTRADIRQLAEEMSAVPAPPAPSAAPSAADIGSHLAAFIRGYERLLRVMPETDQRTVLLEEMVTKMRATPLAPYDLPGRFHLSDSAGERLAAVIALRERPDERYLRWLAERLGVEYAFAGYHAAAALVEAARQLPTDALERVTDAVEEALGWIPPSSGRTGRRKKLQEALTVLSQRR